MVREVLRECVSQAVKRCGLVVERRTDVVSSPEMPPNERKPSEIVPAEFLAELRRRRDWYVARTMTPRTLINDM